MFQKFQQLKELKQLRDQAMAMQKALAQEEIVVEEDGIKIKMTGDQKVQRIEIDGEENRKLADVMNKALAESQKVAAKKLQEMGGGLGGLLGGR
jgi:DNA-binding protein YbaB